MNTAFLIKLEQFEGPLDLLLHLIKVNEIDIFEIDLLFLAGQYFAFLRLVNFRDLADAGDFLQIAATLIEIKSRRLIPREEKEDELLLPDQESTQQELKQRLLTLYCIKEATKFFQDRYLRSFNFHNHEWQRLSSLPDFQVKATPRGDKWTLPVLYEQLLVAVATRKEIVPQAKLQKIKIEIIMAEITERLTHTGFTSFQDFYQRIESRFVLVVYFIAVLEMAKSGQLMMHQEEISGTIWIHPV